ncbi:hypothetical protein J3R83DRAFT_4957 [Lanmaoa asiatica]|nr:hypothetical protein J3R83DRAFT_4957 [Lanmaoa asiatica]
MADQTELAFVKNFVKTIAVQPVAFDDDYQAPPHLALKRVPILSPRAPPADAQRLLLKGKALVDTKLLKEYDVKDGDTINLMVKPGFDWDSTKTLFPTSEQDMNPSDTQSATKLTPGHRHTRTPSIVLSPSPSVASLEPERNLKPQDITLTLDASTIPTALLSPATRSSYQTTICEPAFWSRLLSFLRYNFSCLHTGVTNRLPRAEFSNEGDALIAFEDFLRASKGGMTASEIAKIRDHVGVVGMAGT